MSAIITDQFRISNALEFVNKVTNSESNYYLFTGLSNAEEYSDDWNTNPPSFADCFNEENKCWETMFSLKKINSNDVKPVIRRYNWESGTIYDMYHHNININSPSYSTNASSLYTSKFYVVNKDYRVYICLNNGYDPSNRTGRPSLDEPTFVDLEPRSAGTSGDGYVWKYLYTIKPSDVIKFDSTNYIPVPTDWLTNSDYKAVRDNSLPSSGSGQIKVVLVKDRGSNLANPGTYTNIPIVGDGTEGTVAVVIGTNREVERIFITNGGSGYTFGIVDLSNAGFNLTTPPEFEVIIPPQNGHGANIFRELGPTNVLIYSRFENDIQDPDFIINNKIARIGIVENPEAYDSTSLLQKNKASATGAIIIKSPDKDNVVANSNTFFTQSVGTGQTAVGRVVSYDQTTGVLKYWQDRTMVGYTTSGSLTSPNLLSYGLGINNFTSGTINFQTTSGDVDSAFSGDTLVINNNTYYLGQNFQDGISNPEIKHYSGNIIYVDNRPSITRSLNQKEDIKIILQF